MPLPVALRIEGRPLPAEVRAVRLRVSAGAVPAIELDLLRRDEPVVRAALQSSWTLETKAGPLEVQPLGLVGGTLHGLAVPKGLLDWFGHRTAGTESARWLFYQRAAHGEDATRFLTRALQGRLRKPPRPTRLALAAALPPLAAVARPAHQDHWGFLGTLVATSAMLCRSVLGWVAFHDPAAAIALLTNKVVADLAPEEWTLGAGRWPSRYSDATNPTDLRLDRVPVLEAPALAGLVVEAASGRGDAPAPGVVTYRGVELFCRSVELDWSFATEGHPALTVRRTLTAGPPPLVPPVSVRCGGRVRGWADPEHAALIGDPAWRVVTKRAQADAALSASFLTPAPPTGQRSGFYARLVADQPVEILIVPGAVPTALGGRQRQNPKLDEVAAISLHAETLLVAGGKLRLDATTRINGPLELAGTFDVLDPQTPAAFLAEPPPPTPAEAAPADPPPAAGKTHASPVAGTAGSSASSEATATDWRQQLIAAIDADPIPHGAGIILIDKAGNPTEIRGGQRAIWMYIAPVPLDMGAESASPTNPAPTFLDRWGGSFLSCGSAAASVLVISLSGGVGSFVIGALAVNSVALCAVSVGKAFADETWQEFEREGGKPYMVWMTVETLLQLVDFCNGVKGAITFLKNWKNTGKLARLARSLDGRKLTRKELLKVIQGIDPEVERDLAAKGPEYVSRAKLVIDGKKVLASNQFKSLGNQQARVLVDTVGNALTSFGTPDTYRSVDKTYHLYLVQYKDKPAAVGPR